MPRGSRQRDRLIQQFWEERITAAKKRKADYSATAADVMAYFKADHGPMYQSEAIKSGFMDFTQAGVVSVPKVAQMRSSLGPRLYYTKPVRNVIPQTEDGVSVGLGRCLEAYLNYSAREGKLPKHMRRSIDDGMLRGRMVLETWFDPLLGIVTSRYVPSSDLLIDPDVNCIEDAEWIAFKNVEPIWRLKRRVSEKWRLKEIDSRFKKVKTERDPSSYGDLDDETKDFVPGSNYQIESWVILSKMGVGFRGYDMDSHDNYKDTDDYVRLEVAVGALYPLSEDEWDVPYYLDRDWPVATQDLIETIDELWPESICGQVISLQKAIDLLTSLRLNSCKNRDRTLIACDAALESKIQHRIKTGTAAELLPIELKNQADSIATKIMAIDLGTGTPESAMERQYLENQLDVTAGITPVLTGADMTDAKDRSATASNIRADATGGRVQDLKLKVQDLCTEAARHEAIAVRLMLDPDDVEKIVQFKDIRMFYVEVTPPGGAVVPVRKSRLDTGEQPLSLEEIYPDASTYFEDPVECIQAALEVFEAMKMHQDPRVQELLQALAPAVAQGMDGEVVRQVDPTTGLPPTISVGLVTPERIWIDTAGVTSEELFREFGYEIMAGDSLRADKGLERQNADTMVNNLLPIMIQNMDYEGANKILHLRNEAYDIPMDQRVSLTPPPPPPEEGAPPSE